MWYKLRPNFDLSAHIYLLQQNNRLDGDRLPYLFQWREIPNYSGAFLDSFVLLDNDRSDEY